MDGFLVILLLMIFKKQVKNIHFRNQLIMAYQNLVGFSGHTIQLHFKHHSNFIGLFECLGLKIRIFSILRLPLLFWSLRSIF